jgi:serine/threonine protein kinase
LMDHPNIMPLEMLYEGSQFVYCLTPLYSGGCLLDAIIKAGNFSQFRSIVYLKQLLMAAAYMEAKDHMHRDIKPENVLLTEGGEDVILVDFGFATKTEEYDQLFVRCGTPGYVAPEILQDVPYDPRVDVFSIGVILYVMLTGNVPFASEDPDELIDMNARCEVDFDLTKFGVYMTEDRNLVLT